MKVLLAVDEPHARPLADGLEREGVHVTMVLEAAALALTADDTRCTTRASGSHGHWRTATP